MGPRGSALLVALVSACSFDPSGLSGGPNGDATALDSSLGVDGAAVGDAAAVTDGAPLGVWSTPTLITELFHTSGSDDPSLTADRLEIFFNSSRGGSEPDIWTATRASTSDPWGTPTHPDELDIGNVDSTPEVSADGLTIWFNSDLSGNPDIYVATRASRTDTWSTPVAVTELNTLSSDYGSAPDSSLTTIILNSGRTGGQGGQDLYLSTRADASSTWVMPTVVTEINTTASELSGYLVAAARVVYFHSNRDGPNNLYVASRPILGDSFGVPAAISELNSSSAEDDPWVSDDQRTIVFASTRNAMGQQLYEATR